MWTLFTTALARGNSTTQVSVMNTSSNFVLTAILGFAIFSEALPPLWWVGAAMLVAGSVIVGRKDEGKSEAKGGEGGVGEDTGLGSGSGEGMGSSRRGNGGGQARGRAQEEEEEEMKDEDVADLRK